LAADSSLEEGVSSEPVSESPKFPASSELTGIFGDRGSAAPEMLLNRHFDQSLAGYFPTHPNREIFGGLQGINLSDQGNYSPYQGIRILSNSG
jgi:hypothetical protein